MVLIEPLVVLLRWLHVLPLSVLGETATAAVHEAGADHLLQVRVPEHHEKKHIDVNNAPLITWTLHISPGIATYSCVETTQNPFLVIVPPLIATHLSTVTSLNLSGTSLRMNMKRDESCAQDELYSGRAGVYIHILAVSGHCVPWPDPCIPGCSPSPYTPHRVNRAPATP